ncbi:DNA polymerase IV [Kurthia senegalensis]|uniref:DNA polymerase IV n=1 Tax=Kurthia senegalensis TaxID=1033740 RepID=UPI0005AB251B|nr:DNA polymerase IV [Kurthia senegalensis]
MKLSILFHIDMNCFYASVEQSLNPRLKGKPVAVGGDPKERRGVIVTCSYEARALGIYTTMRVTEAVKMCPQLIVLKPNFERYREASKKMFDILRSYTPLVEPVSIDEGYMDVSDLVNGKEAIRLAAVIQQRLQKELDLPCSIGIAPNKFLAKTASDMKKPLGITVLRKREVPHVLWQLPVIDMHGIGKSTAQKLKTLHIQTIGDLATCDEAMLKKEFGKNGVRLFERANGIDRRAVDPESVFDTKSVGNSTTLAENIVSLRKLEETISSLASKVASRLQSKFLAGTTLSLQLRTADWKQITRSKSFTNALYKQNDIAREAKELARKHWNGEALRLVGISISHVENRQTRMEQLDLFTFKEHIKDEPVMTIMNELREKYGEQIIVRGMANHTSNFESPTSFSKDFLDDHRK